MQVQVSGKHVDVGEALRTRVSDEVTATIGKYFDRGGTADVVVARDGYNFKVDCTIRLDSGQMLQSHGEGARPTRPSAWRSTRSRPGSGATNGD
jgi:ribosomal subunit interface protein